MKQTDVSFIFTCYNFEKYIAEALHSILNQHGNYEIEIIVFDDNSTDNSAKIISQIIDKRITFIHNQVNIGASACINKGFEMAKGKYICRFDGDDKWKPEFLETVIPIMEQNPDVGLLFGNYMPMDINSNNFAAQKINRPTHLQTKDNDFKDILKKYYINAPTIIFRKEALQAAFPIPQKFGNFADWYLSLTVLKNWKSYYLDTALAYYRIHESNNHRRAIRNGTDEKITETLLEEFAKYNQSLSDLEKQDIYASNYYRLAFKYLGENMEEDGKKYFKKTLQHNKKYLFDIYFMRFFIITYIGKEKYEKLKRLFKI
jgi:glycosyltransferase involved in cell wall biosynthesis